MNDGKPSPRIVGYWLDGHTPMPCYTIIEWGQWMENADRRVAKTHLPGRVYVSTVFLGIDYNFTNEGPPIVFETMVFGGEFDQRTIRYATWDEAEQGHAAMVKTLEGG